MGFGALLETLDEEARRSIDAVRDLPDAAFAMPTRCPPWDVRVLVGHMVRDLDRVLEYLAAEPAPDAATTDAVGYWRTYDPRAEGPRITAELRRGRGSLRDAGLRSSPGSTTRSVAAWSGPAPRIPRACSAPG